MNKAIIVSGYFNPVHRGHIELFINAKVHAEKLFVIVNNDYQRKLKGSKAFMLEAERAFIVSNLKQVDSVFLSIDKDRTVVETIKHIHDTFPQYKLLFGNGGDQNNNSIPEAKICTELGIDLVEDLGKKVQSSSWLLKK